MFYLCYLYLFPYSGVQHILCCVFCFVCLPLVCPVCFFLFPLRDSLTFIYIPQTDRDLDVCQYLCVPKLEVRHMFGSYWFGRLYCRPLLFNMWFNINCYKADNIHNTPVRKHSSDRKMRHWNSNTNDLHSNKWYFISIYIITKMSHDGILIIVYLCSWKINVKENRNGNQEWTMQRNRQHWVHKTEDKQNKKHNTKCVGHHQTQDTRRTQTKQKTQHKMCWTPPDTPCITWIHFLSRQQS